MGESRAEDLNEANESETPTVDVAHEGNWMEISLNLWAW